jgi:flagellar biogenesis protein FliO
MTGVYVQMVAALAAVVSLIFLLSFLYRRRQKAPGLMDIVAYQSLGPKRGIAALRVGGEILIIGVTPTDFKLLRTLDEKDFHTGDAVGIAEKLHRLRKIKEGMDG